ncbi:hypothetical protein [Kitasatospora mediocidica]|nr:hypothetical protein [Kitasatospora mediocidica]
MSSPDRTRARTRGGLAASLLLIVARARLSGPKPCPLAWPDCPLCEVI